MKVEYTLYINGKPQETAATASLLVAKLEGLMPDRVKVVKTTSSDEAVMEEEV